MTHPKQYSQETVDLFLQMFNQNTAPAMNRSVATFTVGGVTGTVRIKRAKADANQVQVWRGQPILVHIPAASSQSGMDEWVMLDVAWQLQFAASHPNHNQHASNTFDCMRVPMDEVKRLVRIDPKSILAVCQQAVMDAQAVPLQFVTRAIVNVQRAVSQALFQTYRDIVNPPTLQYDGDDDDDE